jgi:twitching motility two-component system response regulator PilG
MSDTSSNDPSLIFSEAVLAVKLGQNDLARGLFGRILNKNPRHEHALLWSAALCDVPTQAIRLLEQLLSINPGNQQAAATLSLLQLSRTTPQIASGDAGAECPKEPPKPPAALSGRTWVCQFCSAQMMGEPEVCRRCGVVYDVNDLEAIGRNRLGDEPLLLAGLQRWEQSERYTKTVEGQLNLAKIYLNLRRSQDAIPHLANALEMEGGGREDLRHTMERLHSRPLVLAVDDSLTIRRIIPAILEPACFRAITACGGEEALEKAASVTPDLILLDVDMPGWNGYRVARELRKISELRRTPIVILSGTILDRLRGRLAGANDYVSKPFEPERLLEVIDRNIRSSRLL